MEKTILHGGFIKGVIFCLFSKKFGWIGREDMGTSLRLLEGEDEGGAQRERLKMFRIRRNWRISLIAGISLSYFLVKMEEGWCFLHGLKQFEVEDHLHGISSIL
ncbi:hypothetical protein SUGI_0070690 [Cryptomeria japonica]|nr:hypothetical protein SUGI_0070690 [Cryptomeria japonica]